MNEDNKNIGSIKDDNVKPNYKIKKSQFHSKKYKHPDANDQRQYERMKEEIKENS